MEDPLAEEILKSAPKEGDTLHIDFDKKEDILKVSVKKAKKKASKKEKDQEQDSPNEESPKTEKDS